MKALKLIYGQSFEPDVVEMLGDVFDDVWAEIAVQLDPDNDPETRLQLARTVLSEYREGMDASALRRHVFSLMLPALNPAQLQRTA